MVVRLPQCIQVPESLWADGWHYTCEGFDVFADEFAAKLIAHLRDRGMTVEGTGLRSRACASGARAEICQTQDCFPHVRDVDK
jgi:hypothetical protein